MRSRSVRFASSWRPTSRRDARIEDPAKSKSVLDPCCIRRRGCECSTTAVRTWRRGSVRGEGSVMGSYARCSLGVVGSRRSAAPRQGLRIRVRCIGILRVARCRSVLSREESGCARGQGCCTSLVPVFTSVRRRFGLRRFRLVHAAAPDRGWRNEHTPVCWKWSDVALEHRVCDEWHWRPAGSKMSGQ